jgi:hypothetical protein
VALEVQFRVQDLQALLVVRVEQHLERPDLAVVVEVLAAVLLEALVILILLQAVAVAVE